MTPYSLYRLYQAMKLHFSSEKYDVIASRGFVKCASEDTFKKKPLYKRFWYLSSQFDTTRDAVQFFVSVFVYDANIFNQDECHTAFVQWKKFKAASTYFILEELESLPKIPEMLSGDPCDLMKRLSGKLVSYETAVAINRVYPFIEEWKLNFTHPQLYLKIKKMDAFVSYNTEKVHEKIKSMV